ncbi:MAG TPA: CPBP family intramembrane glutamic endopeptidase [Acidobacteriaceae bacterium]|nr:CPBP family intramembrane glutamic endopeptidase [Acidobacteriaceae bacterium]
MQDILATAPTFVAPTPVLRPQAEKPLRPLRSFGRFLLAIVYFLLARVFARHGAIGLVPESWVPVVEQAMLVFLLVMGYAGMAFVLDRQVKPVSRQGLPLRSGWSREAGLGIAFGWTIAVICALLMALFGGIALQLSFSVAGLGWFCVDLVYYALFTLAIQVVYRGYPFEQAIAAMGEIPATLMLAVLYGILRNALPGASGASMGVSVALSLLLAMATLRTRALWLPWGLHFGWIASRALLFGLPVSGVNSRSTLIQGDSMARLWISGGQFGLDGSWLAFFVLLLAMPFLYRATRDLSFHFNAPVLEPAGVPVDLDAAARRQHEAAMGEQAPAEPGLVQILPVTPAPPPLASDLDGPRD